VQDYSAVKQQFPVWAELGKFGIKKAQKGSFGKFWTEMGGIAVQVFSALRSTQGGRR
jgi:hypothetical protein